MEEKKANLFIVGAMKAGTTTFLDLLSQHHDIYLSPVKEPHFFINELPKNLYEPSQFFNLTDYLHTKFPEPLHITKIENENEYKKLFSLSDDQKYLAEGSTAYLHAEESARLIHNYNPNAKIIVLLRDPLKRSFSHFKMNIGKGREINSFEKALVKEIELYNKNELTWNTYLGMSFYNKAIARYKNLFSEVLTIEFEALIRNRVETLNKVSQFLEIDSFSIKEIAHKNESKTLRFPKLFYFLKKLGLKDYFSILFNSSFKQWLFSKISKRKKQKIVLSEATSHKLETIFKKESY